MSQNLSLYLKYDSKCLLLLLYCLKQPYPMVAGLCHFVFLRRTQKDEKTPCEKRSNTRRNDESCKATRRNFSPKRRKNAMRKDERHHTKRRRRQNDEKTPREKTKRRHVKRRKNATRTDDRNCNLLKALSI